MIAVGIGTAVGLNALLSRKIGEHKIEEACQVATTGIFFSGTISSKMTANPELETLCKQYLSINLVYCWGIFLQTYAQRLLQAVGDTVLSMFSLIIGAVLNIILNPIIHVRLKNYHFKWQDVADIYRVGLPTIILQAIGSIMTFVVNRILLDVSATAVAFFSIYYKLQNFLMMPINGLGQAAIPIVGYNYGNKKFQRVQQTWNILLPTGAVIALCGTVIFWCFPGQLLQLQSCAAILSLDLEMASSIWLALLYVNSFYWFPASGFL